MPAKCSLQRGKVTKATAAARFLHRFTEQPELTISGLVLDVKCFFFFPVLEGTFKWFWIERQSGELCVSRVNNAGLL